MFCHSDGRVTKALPGVSSFLVGNLGAESSLPWNSQTSGHVLPYSATGDTNLRMLNSSINTESGATKSVFWMRSCSWILTISLVFLEEGHYYIPAFELMFHSSLFLRNFHLISASWMSPFRKVRCFSCCFQLCGVAVSCFGKESRKVRLLLSMSW